MAPRAAGPDSSNARRRPRRLRRAPPSPTPPPLAPLPEVPPTPAAFHRHSTPAPHLPPTPLSPPPPLPQPLSIGRPTPSSPTPPFPTRVPPDPPLSLSVCLCVCSIRIHPFSGCNIGDSSLLRWALTVASWDLARSPPTRAVMASTSALLPVDCVATMTTVLTRKREDSDRGDIEMAIFSSYCRLWLRRGIERN